MAKIYHYTVMSKQMTGDTTLEVLLHADNPQKVMSFEPGQYAALSFIRHRRPTPTRCFSITSSPTDQAKLQFGIHVGGHYTNAAMKSLSPGSKVIVEGPFGSCVYNTDRDYSAVLVAGGIGITPFISMIRYASRLQLQNNMYLFYSTHSQEDIPFLNEIVQLEQYNPRLHVLFAVSTGPVNRLGGQAVLTGHLEAAKIAEVLGNAFTASSYFVCGPPGFMRGMTKQLTAGGVPDDQIMTESFSQGQAGPRALNFNVPLQVYAAAALGVVLGAGSLLLRDTFGAPVSYSSSGSTAGTQVQGINTPANSRQQSIGNTIQSLGSTGSGSSSNGNPVQSGGSGSANSSNGSQGSNPSGSGSGSGSNTGSGSNSGGSPAGSGSTSPSPSSNPSPSSSPTPAPSVAPAISFGATKTQITSGQSTELSWSINSDATQPVACTASGGWSGSTTSSGSQSFSPKSTTTYKLSCTNSAGSDSRSVTVNVAPACVSTPSNPC